jgi:hypothetical protein
MPALPAPIPGSIDREALDAASRLLSSRASTIVGWGTGSVFDYFHGLHPIRLDYLVDNDRRRWGQQCRGVEVAPPARLAAERPDTAVVIVYSSAWPDIQAQAAGLCGAPAVPASAVFADASVRAQLAGLDALAAAPARRSPSSRDTIVVQGPVLAGVTARVLRALSALHPHDPIVLSTWAGTDPALLDAVRPAVDEVVLSSPPACDGIQNRNRQIVSTRAGIRRAVRLGARMVLKTRTDVAVLDGSVFDRARRHLARFDARAARARGLRDRLIIPSAFTRRFLLYHPSDLVMLGHAADMEQYWSAAVDDRQGDLLSEGRVDRPLAEVCLDGHPAESYLGVQFNRTIGRPVDGTLADSWDFYRDFFAVVGHDWFDLLWLKNLAVPDLSLRLGPRQLVTPVFWDQLEAGERPPVGDECDPARVTLRAFTGRIQ